MKIDKTATFGAEFFPKDDSTNRVLALSPGATRLFATSDKAKKNCVSLPSGEFERALKLRGIYHGAMFLSEDQLMVFGHNKSVLFDVTSGAEIATVKIAAASWALRPAGDQIALAEHKGKLILVGADGAVELEKKLPKGQGDAWRVLWSDDEHIVLMHGTAEYDYANSCWNQSCRISRVDREGNLQPNETPPFENRRIAWVQSPGRDRIFLSAHDLNAHGGRARAMVLDARTMAVQAELPTLDTASSTRAAAFVDDDRVVCLSQVDLDPNDRSSRGRFALEVFSLSGGTVEEVPLDASDWGYVGTLAASNGRLVLASLEHGLISATLSN